MGDKVLRINGVDVSALHLTVTAARGVWTTPQVEQSYLPIPGRFGALPIGPAVGREKRIPVTLAMSSRAVADRRGRLDDVIRLMSGQLRIEWSDAPGRFQVGTFRMLSADGLWQRVEWVWGDLSIDGEFVIPDAVSWSSEATIVALPAGVLVPLPLGTSTVEPVISVAGAWTNLRLSYVDSAYRELSALQLAGTVAAGTVTEIMSRPQRIVVEDLSTGVRTSRLDLYGGGSFPVFDPLDGTPLAPPHMSSTADAIVTYTRGWE